MDELNMGLYLFLHVVVAVLDGGHGSAFAVAAVYLGGEGEEQRFAGLEALCVVVADDVAEGSLGHAALHIVQMEEALIAAGVLRHLSLGQHIVELYCDGGGVDHYVLCLAGVYAHAVNSEHGGGGVEVFVFYLAYGSAVHGVAEVAAQSLYVYALCAAPYLLIGGEYDLYFPVGPAALHEPFNG